MWGRRMSQTCRAKLSHSGTSREHIQGGNFHTPGRVSECTVEVLIKLDALM